MCFTKREIEVMKLIAEGNSNQSISEKLSISLSTVKAHVSNILTKLNGKNRVDIVIYAFKHNIVQI